MAYFDDVSVLYIGLIGAVAVSGLPLLVAMAIFFLLRLSNRYTSWFSVGRVFFSEMKINLPEKKHY